MVQNSLSFCLSEKLLISPSYLNEILAGYSNLGCRLFSFITLSMACHSLLAWRVSIERSAVILMGIPLCVICCFSLAAFNICSLCLIFVNLINMSTHCSCSRLITWLLALQPKMLFFKIFTQLIVSHSSNLDSYINSSEKVSPHPLAKAALFCPTPIL